MAGIMGNVIYEVELNRPSRVFQLGNLYTGDQYEYRYEVHLTENGQPVDCSGVAVNVYAIRADGQTVVTTGTGNAQGFSVTLPASMHQVVGRIAVAARLVLENVKHVSWAAEGTVQASTTDVMIDPGHVVPNIDDLLAQIQRMEQATAGAEAVLGDIAELREADRQIAQEIGGLGQAIGQNARTIDAINAVDERQDARLRELEPDIAALQSSDAQQWKQVDALTDAVGQHTREISGLQGAVGQHTNEITAIMSVDRRQDDQIDRLQHKVTNLEMAAAGYLFRTETVEGIDYRKDVPPDAMPYASLDMIGALSLVDGGRVNDCMPDKIRCYSRNLLDTDTSKIVAYYSGTDKKTLRYGYEYTPEYPCIISAHGRGGNAQNPVRLYEVRDEVFYTIGTIADYVGNTTAYVLNAGVHYFVTATCANTASVIDRVIPAKLMIERGTEVTSYVPYSMVAEYDLAPLVQKYFQGSMRGNAENHDEYDEINLERGVAIRRIGVASPVETVIVEADIAGLRDLHVDANGSVVFVNQFGDGYSIPMPGRITYMIKL